MTTTIYALYEENVNALVSSYTPSLDKLFKYLIEDEIIDDLEIRDFSFYKGSKNTEIDTFADVLETEEDREDLYNFFMGIIYESRRLHESEKDLFKKLEAYFFDCIIITAEYVE